jgi:hypothetical protein
MGIESALRVKELDRARVYSYRKLARFRDERMAALRQYVGSHYGESPAADKVPLNMLELAVNIYLRQFVASAPRMLITTKIPTLAPQGAVLEEVMNKIVVEIQLRDTLREWIKEAFFGMGVLKVGLTEPDTAYGVDHIGGMPFCEVICLEDWVHDVTAKQWEAVAFMGNRYRLPLESILASDLYRHKGILEKLGTAAQKDDANADEFASEEQSNDILSGRADSMGEDLYYEMVELWDLWLPQEGVLVTVPCGRPDKIIRAVDWDGPRHGPYHRLAFEGVPGNVMPLPPSSLWMDMHDLANRLFRKLGRQAERQKTVIGVQSPAANDGERVIKASDGEMIRLDNPQAVTEINFGGIDQHNLQFTMFVKELFTYYAGNLDALGGLSPQADTLGQDQLLTKNASKRVAEMQEHIVQRTADVMKDLTWYRWTDPVREDLVEQKIPGALGLGILSVFGPNGRVGSFMDFDFTIHPYSMQHSSPGERLQTIVQLFTQFILPLMPMMQQQGLGVNFDELLRMVSKYSGMDEIDRLLIRGEPQMPETEGGGQPANTTRTYQRQNIPGRSNRGFMQTMMQTLAGKAVQPSEAESAVRR